jgi:hypothetical protein
LTGNCSGINSKKTTRAFIARHNVHPSILLLPGSLLSALSIYFVLSYLLVPFGITFPISILTSILIFGLSKYYVEDHKEDELINLNLQYGEEKKSHESKLANLIFIGVFIVMLIIVSIPSNKNPQGFVPWEQITIIHVLKLVAATALSFFLPGYALVIMWDRKQELKLLPKALLAYLFSILISGLAGLISGALGYPVSDINIFIISAYILILILFSLKQTSIDFHYNTSSFYNDFIYKVQNILKKKNSQLLVFTCLLALVILYTYYLHHGVIIGDQWYHLGRSLIFITGQFKDLISVDSATLYPPFFSAFLSTFFTLSGSPPINAYVSINFLNITPVFAFYYFFICWVPRHRRRAALLASTLFMLSAGFGWVYVLGTAINEPAISKLTALEVLHWQGLKTSDVRLPTTFVVASHPDFSTQLIIIALPAGFVLLGLLKQENRFSRFRYVVIIVAISLLGVLSHDEFFLFILIASVLPLIFNLRNKHFIYLAFSISLAIVISIDFALFSGKYYIVNEILGVPLIALCFLFVIFSWILYTLGVVLLNWLHKTKTVKKIYHKILSNYSRHRHYYTHIGLVLGIIIVSAVAYFYSFTFIVLGDLSDEDLRVQRGHYYRQPDIPWYLYPMKFGLTGLLGLAFILSYIFKKFEKEVFVFGLIVIIALLAGPYYDEHRFSKYVMVGMAAFASLLVYKIISSTYSFKLRPLVISLLLGFIITSCGFSIFMFAGYNALSLENPQSGLGFSRRDFPTSSEMQLLDFLRNNSKSFKTYNIAVPQKEVEYNFGFISKLEGFSAIPMARFYQSPLTLNASTLEGFYKLLNYSDTRYIVLPNKDIPVELEEEKRLQSNGGISETISFALDNFAKVYQDENYTVLEVPHLAPPTSSSLSEHGNVALVYQKDTDVLLPPISYRKVLPYNNELFDFASVPDSGDSENENSNSSSNNLAKRVTTKTLILDDSGSSNGNNGTTLWSYPIIQYGYLDDNMSSTNSPMDNHNNEKINYIESDFRVIDIQDSNSTDKKYNDDDAGILWEYGNKEYYLSLSKHGLQLSQGKPIITTSFSDKSSADDNKPPLLLSQNQEIKKDKGIWYNLKIVVLKNTISIYVDNMLRIQAPINKDYSSPSLTNETNIPVTSSSSISKVGIRSFHNVAEFQPITIGRISEAVDESYQKEKIYAAHYYPLSALALSNIKYDTFIDGDFSALSKKYVILTFDPSLVHRYDVNKYLEFVRSGGNLIVMNTDNKNNEGMFSKLLSLKQGNSTEFNSIVSYLPEESESKVPGKYPINTEISGVTRHIGYKKSPDVTVKSFYLDKIDNDNNRNQTVAVPFAIEKNYGNGKIFFVNAAGYFESIFDKSSANNNHQDFLTLSNIPDLIGLNVRDKEFIKNSLAPDTITAVPQIIGDLKISVPIHTTTVINSSSLLLNDEFFNSYNLSAKDIFISSPKIISISNDKESTANELIDDSFNSQTEKRGSNNFKNVLIKNLKLYGEYEVIVNSTGRPLRLPTASSQDDYIGINIRSGFDITIKLSDSKSAYAEFDIITKDEDNIRKYSTQTVRVFGSNDDSYSSQDGNSSKIHLHKVKSDSKGITSISLLMKSPEIRVTKEKGKEGELEDDEGATIVTFRRDSPRNAPTEVKGGDTIVKLDYVDHYNQPFRNGTRTQFITYLKEDIPQTTGGNSNLLEIPGDISELAKEKGIGVPWQKAIVSFGSILVLISIIVIVIGVIYFLRSKIKEFGKGPFWHSKRVQ